MKAVAAWIMNRMVCDGGSEWALAMRSEFDELENGHLRWALGCVGAVGIEYLRKNGLFLLGVLLGAYFMVVVYPKLAWQLALYDAKLYTEYFFTIDHFGHLPVAAALGFWRPTRAFTIMFLGGFLGYTFGGILYVMQSFNGSFWEWLTTDVNYQVMGRSGENAPLATAIDLAVWYAGARVGGWFSQRRLRVN